MLDDELKKKILSHYQKGQGSIQDIARVYRVTVDEVLEIIGETELINVQVGGDMIDSTEAGPGAEMNYGQTFKTPFSLD